MAQDYVKAARLYGLAAAQGHAHAQVELGLLYREGKGVPHCGGRAAVVAGSGSRQRRGS